MKTLFLAWQAPDIRNWFPVGRLDADQGHGPFIFRYTQGAIDAQEYGFHPMPAFPDFCGNYRSNELFSMFRNRVLASRRKGFNEYLQTLDLDRDDPIEILAITGGERQTDSFELFPKVEKKDDSSFKCRFFLHGLRYMTESAQQRATRLQVGEALGVSVELTNPKTGVAIQLTTNDYEFIGWTPRYLVSDLLKSIADVHRIGVSVVKVNAGDVPLNRRVLVEFVGHLPGDAQPMSGAEFQPIACDQTAH